uniref:Uncharacterized protein n=1 Tax=Arion vulgaris TaxID=1028688 RepID=A0A0B7AUK7_9EUPU
MSQSKLGIILHSVSRECLQYLRDVLLFWLISPVLVLPRCKQLGPLHPINGCMP